MENYTLDKFLQKAGLRRQSRLKRFQERVDRERFAQW
jgi:hypothetical protein